MTIDATSAATNEKKDSGAYDSILEIKQGQSTMPQTSSYLDFVKPTV